MTEENNMVHYSLNNGMKTNKEFLKMKELQCIKYLNFQNSEAVIQSITKYFYHLRL